MRDNRSFLLAGLVTSILIGAWIIYPRDDTPERLEIVLDDVPIPEFLKNHSEEFSQPEVIQVTDGVYVAIGFALANVVMVEAPKGIIIVDVTESVEAAEEVRRAFRNITTKPVKAIIYTHSHADHVLGAKVFLAENADVPEIWAHHSIMDHYDRSMRIAAEITLKRASRQFGMYLGTNLVNAGIGPRLRTGNDFTTRFVLPNKFLYKEREKITIAGLEVELMHIPGETSDQIGVWIPSKRVLLCADDLYKAFPNLYAIRGTPTRDLLKWKDSLDKMRRLDPEVVVPSHTRPLVGRKYIYDLFTIYRDAIQFVHDQTVRFMNKGLTPDEIVERVTLPDCFGKHPHLQQFYGTLAWSIRGTFHGYLGWFSGDATDLSPLTRRGKAQRLVSLGGGVENVLVQARKALDDSDWQWALELASSVIALAPSNRRARELKLEALKKAAAEQISACARNYYLTSALEEARQVHVKPNMKKINEVIRQSSLEQLFLAMSRRLKAEDCSDQNTQASFTFTDTNVSFCVHLRHGIADVTGTVCPNPKLKLETTKSVWIQILTREVSQLGAYTSGQISIDGGARAFKQFISCFEQIE
ncbi:linear primary-alkylsulfatase-like [Liolophura sinensis]|uniref:linear primary-alkylsulfatase-like n=1 Tax=Liolophura sinensis TaxID=3198878 RepID=UPI003158A6D7